MTNNVPLISVIIPIYNVAPYLKQCIDSVISQTYRNLEIILVNDGSPDNCGTICDEYAANDNRIIVIHKENGGLSSARNAGIDICKGKYISFIDSDDFISPYFIEIMYRGISEFDSDISSLCSGVSFLDGDDTSVVFANDSFDCLMNAVDPCKAIRLMLYQRIPNGAPWRLYKREIFREIRFPLGYLYEDAATTHRTFFLAKKITLINADIYAYRIRQNSIIRMAFSPKKLISIPISKNIIKEIDAYDSSLYKAARARAFAINYHVFLQVPYHDITSKKKLWNEIVKYRKTVLFDLSKELRLKNRIGALISYLGMNSTWKIGRKLIYKKNKT